MRVLLAYVGLLGRSEVVKRVGLPAATLRRRVQREREYRAEGKRTTLPEPVAVVDGHAVWVTTQVNEIAALPTKLPRGPKRAG